MSTHQQDKTVWLNWLKDLNASGYAGMDKVTGEIVDRRTHLDAVPVPENATLGIAAPKPTAHP